MNTRNSPFQTTLSGMLSGIVALRFRQLRWTAAYWARAFGLLPPSGKWIERITFAYIYVLILALLTPTLINLLSALYMLESKAAPALQATTLANTIPALIAVLSVLLMALPWRAWMLRLTFGDMTYLAASPFDRRVLALWRFVEVVFAVMLVCLIPLTLLAYVLAGDSIFAAAVLPALFRGGLAIGLWATPLLALGWHVSLQEYLFAPLPASARWLVRLAILAGAGGLLAYAPDALLLPGRLVVLLTLGAADAAWGWPLLVFYAALGVIVVTLTARHVSLTRAAAGSDVFARIQQLGFMILMDRQLLVSILGEARANESYAAGVLPATHGAATILAREALFYRRQVGQAIQLVALGVLLGLSLIVWRSDNLVVLLSSVVILVLLLPPQLARVYRADMSVAFISQFIRQPLISQLLLSSVAPTLLVMTGLLPALVSLNGLLPDWALGVLPTAWILALIGHVEVVGKGSTTSDRSLASVLLGSLALLVVLWNVTASGVGGGFGLVQSVIVSIAATFGLLMVAEIRHSSGFSA